MKHALAAFSVAALLAPAVSVASATPSVPVASATPSVPVASATPAVPVASATPSTGVEVETLSKNTVDGVDYLVTRITVAPGGGTGWHYHPGQVFGVISEGTLTHFDGGCVTDAVYGAGSPVTEGIGPGFVHNGRNLGATPLVMEVVYINPAGNPLSVDTPGPAGCPVP